jgi:predicted RNA-binding protein with RPS1 domain
LITRSTKTSHTPLLESDVVTHKVSCSCPSCATKRTFLFMTDVVAETVSTETGSADEVPNEVAAIDGVLSDSEQHNTERPARKSLKKKGPQGKPLTEFEVGQTLKGRVKTIASYGAFIDIGAETDGLLHISQLSVDYVANVNDILELNKEYDVRIAKIDQVKKQLGLTLLTEQQEEVASNQAASRAQKSQNREQYNSNNQGGRKDDRAILTALQEKGWNPELFVEGKVASVVDFGAFVSVDASQLNADVTGSFDGLVHISAISATRTNSVSDVLKVDDQVKIRVKSIDKGKVSLTMVSVEDEQARNDSRSSGSSGGYESSQGMGAKDWKESLEKIQSGFPTFSNRPAIVDRRK